MSLAEIHQRAIRYSLLAGLAVSLASCRTASQKMDLSPEMIATPPHRMARSEYPFDAGGRYVDAWAAEGSGRYGRAINTDRSEDGRSGTAEPERRPTPPPRTEDASPSKPAAASTRPGTASRPPAKPSSASTPSAAAKPPAKKAPPKKSPPPKKSLSHTVKRGDSLGSLSRRYGVSIQAIKKANNLKSDRIIDGRRLVIPK